MNNYQIKVKTYKNLDELLNSLDDNDIIAIDLDSYDVYSKSILKKYKVYYSSSVDLILAEYDAEREIVERDILAFVETFKNVGLIEE